MQDKKEFGLLIRKLRLEKRINHTTFSNLCLIPASYLSDLQMGKAEDRPSENIIRRMASVLEVSFEFLSKEADRIFNQVNYNE